MDLVPWMPKRQSVWGPDHALARFRHEVGDLFDRVLRDPWQVPWNSNTSDEPGALPSVNVEDTEDAVLVKAALPGYAAENVSVEVIGDRLTIRAAQDDNRDWNEGEQRYSERRQGSFRQVLTLPASVDAEQVSATHKDGLLTVTLPKNETARPKKIAVRNA
jgi:HSP20 family protein